MSTLLFFPLRLDKHLKELEQKHHLDHRWDSTDKEYVEAQGAFSREKGDQVATAIWAASSRRQFLLKLKAKYAGKCSLRVFL